MRAFVFFGAMLFALASGCRAKPTTGTPCRAGEELRCTGSDHALSCHEGGWVDVSCKGPDGCAHHADRDECDDTRAAVGDPCPPGSPMDYACTPDSLSALACTGGRFALWRNCRGKDGCTIANRHLNCDTTLGKPGDSCEAAGTYSCSTNQEQMMVCSGKVLAVASSCRGPRKCEFDRDGHKVDCDDTSAAEGDPCDRPHRIACGEGGRAELVCEPGDGGASIYVKKRECRRSPCRIENADLYCD